MYGMYGRYQFSSLHGFFNDNSNIITGNLTLSMCIPPTKRVLQTLDCCHSLLLHFNHLKQISRTTFFHGLKKKPETPSFSEVTFSLQSVWKSTCCRKVLPIHCQSYCEKDNKIMCGENGLSTPSDSINKPFSVQLHSPERWTTGISACRKWNRDKEMTMGFLRLPISL